MRGKFVFLLSIVCVTGVRSQSQPTLGMLTHTAGSVDSGYVLFAPTFYGASYLVDKCGKLVHSWPSSNLPFYPVYLLDDGSILRPETVSGTGARSLIKKISWDGTVQWHYAFGDYNHQQHHDIQPLPNGNVLVIMTDMISKADAVAAGRDSLKALSTIGSEELIEYQPVGTDSAIIVWQWRAWDHLVQDLNPAVANYGPIAEHPERINMNFPNAAPAASWLHMNSVKYNAALDQIVISVHSFNEVWVIDHHTTTAEAASHTGGKHGKGGDLLYRWGNPQSYNHGTATEKKLFSQHDAQWIPEGVPHAGALMIFNNGTLRPTGQYSTIDIISPPVDANGNYDASTLPFSPLDATWTYADTPPTKFYCEVGGGAQMLQNGDVLICNAVTGAFTEIDSLKNKVWEYVNPVNANGPMPQGLPAGSGSISVYRCWFYPYSYAAFKGRTLIPGAPIELNPIDYSCSLNIVGIVEEHGISVTDDSLLVFPNPATNRISIERPDFTGSIILYNCVGEKILQTRNTGVITTTDIPNGIYYVVVAPLQGKSFSKMVAVAR